MTNRRMISKDDAENPSYMRLSLRQRYLFDHLMLFADDDGIIPYVLINPKIFPTDSEIRDADLTADLQALEVRGFAHSYPCTEGEVYVQILDWWRRQTIRAEIYKPTLYPTSPYYSPRPSILEPGPKPRSRRRTIDASTNTAQDSVEEVRAAQTISEKTRTGQASGEEDELPFENDGSGNPRYNQL